MDIQGRLRKLEEAISSLEYQQDSCRPFIKLAEDSESLSKINESFASMLSQLSDLDQECSTCESAVEDLGVRVDKTQQANTSLISSEISRKEDTLTRIDQRLNQLEQSFGNIEKENPIDIGEIEHKLKLEIEEILIRAREKLQNEKVLFQETIDRADKISNNQVNDVQKGFKETAGELEEFEIKYHEYIKNPKNPQGDKMNMILAQARAQINEHINECKYEMDIKFRTLRTKFTGDMEQIKKMLEEMENHLKPGK